MPHGAIKGFDFIIVGAGSAGCVLANRLSESGDARVALLEVGGDDRSWQIQMPAALAYPLAGDRFVTRFETVPEPHLAGRMITHPRGKTLGGTSSINGMMYVRGHPGDFDRWEREGCQGWGFADVQHYFKRLESCRHGEDDWRGKSGPLHVRRGDCSGNLLNKAFLAAAEEAGYPLTDDMNGHRQEGACLMEQTICNGVRANTANAYLRPALDRRNLTLLTGMQVISLAAEGTRVVGVKVAKDDDVFEIGASSEVILCAGAFSSPHILLLSGIGPPEMLRAAGVKAIASRPGVGENLHDHPDIVLRHHCPQPVSLHPKVQPIGRAFAGLQWFLTKSGPAATNHFDVGAFIRSEAGVEHPDLQLSFLPLALAPGSVQSDQSIGGHGFQIHIDLVQPQSRGHLWITSGEPTEKPRMIFNYLAEESDRRRLANGMHLAREILSQSAMRIYKGDEITPGATIKDARQLAGWMTMNVDTAYHPVGACKMGNPHDAMAVVDPCCRVIGINGLRVVDSSIMSSIVSGNTNATTIMIAEKAADMILGLPPPTPSQLAPWTAPKWKERQR